jgi:hypothetical protein
MAESEPWPGRSGIGGDAPPRGDEAGAHATLCPSGWIRSQSTGVSLLLSRTVLRRIRGKVSGHGKQPGVVTYIGTVSDCHI